MLSFLVVFNPEHPRPLYEAKRAIIPGHCYDEEIISIIMMIQAPHPGSDCHDENQPNCLNAPECDVLVS